MSRKDYEALAVAILESKTESREALGSFTVLQRTAGRIADVLAADNPRFDRDRFLTACGLVESRCPVCRDLADTAAPCYHCKRGEPTPSTKAEHAGYAAGIAAGSWIVDGNTSPETARMLLQGIEDGDPVVCDSLPSAPLSGEWADGLTPREVLSWYDLNDADSAADDVLSAFEDGYSRGVVEEVTRSARVLL